MLAWASGSDSDRRLECQPDCWHSSSSSVASGPSSMITAASFGALLLMLVASQIAVAVGAAPAGSMAVAELGEHAWLLLLLPLFGLGADIAGGWVC